MLQKMLPKHLMLQNNKMYQNNIPRRIKPTQHAPKVSLMISRNFKQVIFSK